MSSDDRIEAVDKITVGTTGTGLSIAEQFEQGNIVAANDEFEQVYAASTNDVVQTIRDDLNNNGSGGVVFLPPGGETVVTSAALGGFSRQHWYCPSAQDQFVMRFTDYANPGLLIDGSRPEERYTTFENIRFSGDDVTQRTGGNRSAVRFETSIAFWEFRGTCDFTEWGDPVIHMSTGHPFESDWGHLFGQNYEGRFLYLENAGEPLRIRQITAGPNSSTDPDTGATAHTVESFRCGGIWYIETIDHRAAQPTPTAVDITLGNNSTCGIGTMVYESGVTNPGSVVAVREKGHFDLGRIRVVGQDGTQSLDEVYSVGAAVNDIDLPKPKLTGTTINNNLVSIAGDPDEHIEYHGPVEDITNDSGTSPLSHEIECRGPNFTG